MYWPIGLPRIYAASSSSKAHQGRVFLSEDDAASRDTAEGSFSPPRDLSTISEQEESDFQQQVPLTPATPLTPGIKSVDHDHVSPKIYNGDENVVDRNFGQVGKEPVLAVRISRTGHLFATITATTLTIWQTKPTAILAVVIRSTTSLKRFGTNTSLLVRPDSAIFVVQTTLGFLVTYSLASNPDAQVYRPQFTHHSVGQPRRNSHFGLNHGGERLLREGEGVQEVSIRFRMVIRVDAGISKALALKDELVVASKRPACVQCIRWTPDSEGNQTSTDLLSRMSWLPKRTVVRDMVHDRPMSLYTWITDDGRAYAVQHIPDDPKAAESPRNFRGYCFHIPKHNPDHALRAAINARFSLIAVGCVDGSINVYTAKDYVGNVALSHKQKLTVSESTSGRLTFLSYSPDGYCLFVGYERGWAMWSVYGKPGGTSFGVDKNLATAHDEAWLGGIKEGVWLGGGAEILLIGQDDDRLWVLEMARNAVTSCFAPANIARTLLLTKSGIMVYRGYNLPDLTAISAESSLWHNAQNPARYLVNQWPMRCAVISSDARYVAIAGRRGLAHYSVNSGRWRTFVNGKMENDFAVRGGMCWHQHILIAAVEAGGSTEIRLYSRESALDDTLILHTETLPAPVVLLTQSGEESILVYTQQSSLHHYLIHTDAQGVRLMQVGLISFNDIIRAPARVRGLSWILPDDQLLDGDPSQDVATATVVLLIDGKLVLLQPSMDEEGRLKYDMRVIAQNVEYYALIRDQPQIGVPPIFQDPTSGEVPSHGLRDSLWTFDGNEMKLWPDVQDILQSAPCEFSRELPPSVSIPVDFYPLSVLLRKGLLLGVEPELVQRRDMNFTFFRFTIRTHLFIPPVLRFHLSRYDSSAALHLSQHYQHLEYFSHALEVLLHNVLDDEVDSEPSRETALLPGVLSFLSSFPEYLDIVVQCTRKTEVRSWRTLFLHLPPPQELFEQSLQKNALKTAGGYLLVLHNFEELSSSSEQLVHLLGRAKDEGDWELCKELARFLTALDESGATLREALTLVDLKTPQKERGNASFMFQDSKVKVPVRIKSNGLVAEDGQKDGSSSLGTTPSPGDASGTEKSADYFASS